MKNIQERIRHLINLEGLNKNSFSARIGVAAPVIGNILGGRESNPSYELLVKIIKTFDSISLEWLLLGEGPIYKEAIPINRMFSDAKIDDLGDEKYLNKLNEQLIILEAQKSVLLEAFKQLGMGLHKEN